MKCDELLTNNRLGQQVSNHLVSRSVRKFYFSGGDAIRDEEIPYVDVASFLGRRVSLLSHGDGAKVVLPESCGTHV